MGRLKIYLDTSIIISALPGQPESREAYALLEECCRRHQCIYSNVHDLEPWRPETLKKASSLLKRLNARKLEIDIPQLMTAAEHLRKRLGAPPKRVIDIMHVLAARKTGAAILSRDRHIYRLCKRLKVRHITPRKGCP